ncbi:MAG: hypothetical protein U1E65_27350 [Myxococcota bacterium]
MASIGYIQATMAYVASEDASSKTTAGEAKLTDTAAQRKDLQKKIDDGQKDVKKLQAEIQQIQADSGGIWGSFCSLFSDGGLGDAMDALSRTGAMMKKAQQDLTVKQAQIEISLRGLQEAQSELAQHLADHRKVFDEAEKAAKAGDAA